MTRAMRARIVAWLVVGLTLLATPLQAADGQLVTVEKFMKGNAGLAVAYFTDPTAEKTQSRVGLLGIAGSARSSVAFDPGEWRKLVELCNKAIGTKSAGWTAVGAISETGVEGASRLTVSAGPGLTLAISSSAGGTVTYVLEKRDLPRFQNGLRKVNDYLARTSAR